MRSFLFLFCFSLLSAVATAQEAGLGYIDIVHLYAEDARVGTVITYEYGKRVVLVEENGRTSDFAWDKVKRVNFRLDKNEAQRARILANARKKQGQKPAPAVEKAETVIAPPTRRFWHQLDGGFSLGSSTTTSFGFNLTTIGGGFGYHYVREFGRIRAGLGADLSIMSYRRQENIVAGTGLVEWPLTRNPRKLRPFVRFQGGITYPFGGFNSEEEVSARRLSPLYHPSFGFEFGPPADGWGSLMIDIGYRFLSSRFELTTATLDIVERRVVYRRLVIRGGYRF